MKLYYKTHDSRYLDFSKWLLAQRGHGLGTWNSPEYHQDLLPVKEQRKISGHAVRAMYMFTAMADVAAATNDKEYMVALDSLWHDVVDRNMYLQEELVLPRKMKVLQKIMIYQMIKLIVKLVLLSVWSFGITG